VTSPRVLFAGTPEFALASLRAIVGSGLRPVAALTQPDRPSGRGRRMTPSPVKSYCRDEGIEVLQPETLRDDAVVAELAALSPDLIIVAAYGLILPQNVLDLPRRDCINVHASLLPRWRGAAPIQAAILNGDRETGISLMSMTAGLDCGPVYASESLEIDEEETAGELHDRLADLGGRLLIRCLPAILDGELEPIEQDESLAIYAPKIDKRDAVMDWRRSSKELHRLVRAYNPVPGAWFEFGGERIKCWEARQNGNRAGGPGEVLSADRSGLTVACGEGALDLLSVQRPGKRRISGAELSGSLAISGKVLDVPA
jgi:methionyl-tRNA formyltransferase